MTDPHAARDPETTADAAEASTGTAGGTFAGPDGSPRAVLLHHYENLKRVVTPEDKIVLVNTTLGGTFLGFFFGGLASATPTATKWKAENKDTRFSSQLEAQRRLNDIVLKRFSERGMYWGARLGSFIGLFSLINLCMERTREKRDIVNVLTAGCCSGAFLGIPSGPSGVALGLATGAGCSLAFGAMLSGAWWVEDKIKELHPEVAVVVPDPADEADAQAEPQLDVAARKQYLDNMLNRYDADKVALQRLHALSRGADAGADAGADTDGAGGLEAGAAASQAAWSTWLWPSSWWG